MFVTKILSKKDAPERIRQVMEAHKVDEFVRKNFVVTKDDLKLEEGSRTAVQYVSTVDVDRDNEILLPKGCVLSEFRKAPQVLWGHDYDQPPIGKDLWIKTDSKDNPRGILAKTEYATTDRANEVWTLKKGGFLRTSSVGFIPLKSIRQGDADWDKVCDTLGGHGYMFDRTKVKRIYTKWILLEHSDVSVPANINALTVAVAKGMNLTQSLLDELGIDPEQLRREEADLQAQMDEFFPNLAENIERDREDSNKGVIPYADHGRAPEGEDWDGPAEVAAASVEDLMIMCSWYDSDNPDIKAAYKLPHHQAAGKHVAVWRGIAAGMVVVLGGRGGVNVPEKDRKGIYNHLVKEYKGFDKEPPEFRSHSMLELRGLFFDIWEQLLYDVFPALKPFANEHSCRLLSPEGWDRVRRENDKFGEGIHAIWGVKENKAALQAIRFDKAKYTVTQAKKWTKDNKHDCILFEPAKGVTDVRRINPNRFIEKDKAEEEPKPEVKRVPVIEPIYQKHIEKIGRSTITEEEDIPLQQAIQDELERKKGRV